MTSARFSRALFVPVVFAFAGLALACGASGPAPATPLGGGTRPVDPATTGSVTGTVVFTGTPPAAQSVRMSSDPNCLNAPGAHTEVQTVTVGEGGALSDVFVHLKTGVDPDYAFEPVTAPVLLDQQGCHFTPRVVGLRVGQPLEVVNSDATLHNVHAIPQINREFNRMMQMQGQRMQEVFTAPEVMVRFKCDVHGWMIAWVGVVAHPYFAVTDASGAFRLDGVPPGQYTVEAWHETLGTQTTEITIDDAEHQTVAFSFAND